jgi:NhaA family Na+:H+ antiporter
MSDQADANPKFPQERIDAITSPLHRFVHAEASGGVVLLLAAIAALIIANSALGPSFEKLWTTSIGLTFGDVTWKHSIRHWINDGLVTLFFFVVGLEIKREIACGELSAPRAAALPIAAAIGGMVVPAAIYLALASGPQATSGWGVVMATDIAFVVGSLALLGRRIPDSLRVFVLALAIIDDIGAILVIAIGYGNDFHAVPFVAALVGLGVTGIMQWLGIRPMMAYWVVGLLTWVAMHESGIHPTITGVALGLLTPATPWVEQGRLERFLDSVRGTKPPDRDQPPTGQSKAARQRLARAAIESLSPQQRLEDSLHPWSAFVILPLFALANAGVAVSGAGAFDPIALAIIAGLVVGKPLGIFIFAYLAVLLRAANKPADIGWPMILGAGSLCGIGFTMSLFIANLAFDGAPLQSAKLGILLASLISAVIGMALLWMWSSKTKS